jgi:hypothetical protein
MRPPFYLDKVSPHERTWIRQSHLRFIGFYSILALMIVVMATVRMDRLQSQLGKLSPAGEAVAAARSGSPLCAARDIKVVTLIEDAGAARTVPDERLTEAFFTLMKARELCGAGRVAEALAVYDSIAIAPVQAAAK